MSQPVDRRGALRLLGGAVVLAACSRERDRPAPTTGGAPTTAPPVVAGERVTPAMFAGATACSLTPEQAEGPFYVDVDDIRADIRDGREGTPLRLAARVVDVDGCAPVKDAVFDVWHCDANGDYSGFERGVRGSQARFLRGAQVTDADGIAVITTIYPGWYTGRAVHVHAKVLLSRTEAVTTQLYFDDAVSRQVFRNPPYARRGEPDQTNERDRIYRRETTLTLRPEGNGYLGLVTLGIRGRR